MSSVEPENTPRRFNFLRRSTPSGSRDQILVPGSEVAAEAQTTDFSGFKISSDKVERGETSRMVWRLENISNRSNLEALASSSSCIVEMGEGDNGIQLRFFLKPEVTNYPIIGKEQAKKHLSLWCAVLKGGEGKRLTFAVKVDKLSESLQFQQNLVTEKAVIINSARDQQGILIESVFLPYLVSQIRGTGQLYNKVYLLKSVNELCFGFSVTQLQCTGEGRYGEPKSQYSMFDPYETA